ncbi:hypothetical protein [Aureimonas psammosilenae]|nr:hypothetical protein [Aureimonas psammosilenae]
MAHSGDPFQHSTLTHSATLRVLAALGAIGVLWVAIYWAAMLP